MKNKISFFPIFSLIAGIVAMLVRYWYFAEGVERGGLLSATHPGNMIGYILLALVPLVLLICLLTMLKKDTGNVYFGAKYWGFFGNLAAAAGVLGSCFYLKDIATGVIYIAALAVALLAAGCFVLEGICRIKGKPTNPYTHCVITIYFAIQLLIRYRNWNIEPQLQLYLPQLLAFVFLMITAYQRAALAMGKGKPGQYLFFNYGAAFFCMVALNDDVSLFYRTMVLWTALAGTPSKVETEPPMVLPENVLKCIEMLEKKGFTAYVVGGCVRDHLLGRKPHDYDLCTSAKPEDICEIFGAYQLVHSGEKHGTVGVVMDGEVYEITTYRTEGEYTDNRHPDEVTFVDKIEEDLGRRDFTVNAMAYSPLRGYEDPFGGRRDLKEKCLRAVGEPETRFREDALRILRGVRFAVRFQLTPEKKTLEAMFRLRELMDNLAAERILTELLGLLPHVTADDIVRYCPILTQVIPELTPCVDFAQNNPHHSFDVYTHIAHTVAAMPKEADLRLAALLHDVGKTHCYTEDENGCGHFYGHAEYSAELAKTVLARLKAPTALRDRVVFLVQNHMDLFDLDKKHMRRKVSKWGEADVRALMALQRADFAATGAAQSEVDAAYAPREALLETVLQESDCLTLKDLALSGSDLLEMGVAPGLQIGNCLNTLLSLVLDEAIPNEKEALLEKAKELLENSQ
ncbi:MAG: CCA tRNA nucleotidyltransferase [Oscillospiraceae bacterium]|nr:CCA tRNA nucleotidyltransferase [Oscillospiraceae bacterium]